MKTWTASIFLCFVLSACGTIDKPFFWKIEKNGKTSHVLGTMHAGIDIRDLPDYVHDNLNSSKAILKEITIESEEKNPKYYYYRAKNLKDFFKNAEQTIHENIEKKRTIKHYFSDDQWTQIVNRTSKMGIDSSVLPYYTLSILHILVRDHRTTYINFEEDKILSTKSLDAEIEAKALLTKKSLYRLDPLQRMKPICWDMLDAQSVIFYLNNSNYDAVDSLVKQVDDYKTGDAELLLKNERPGNLELEKCLLEERNKHWIHVIDNHHHKDSPLFIAAGVRHFIGKDSVLEYLEKMGYKISRYPLKK